MAEVSTGLVEGYNTLLGGMPGWIQNFMELFLLVLLVFLYSFFVWKFYRFIATKNILHLDLRKYNRSDHPAFTKLLAAGLYLLEYIIVVPFLIFFWYAIFTLFLILLTESLEVGAVLLVSATIIAAVRMASYYKEDLAKDLAKLLPFTLLAVAILDYTKLFDFARIISNITSIPNYMGKISDYFIFIFLLEIVLRFFDFLFIALGFESQSSLEEDEKAEKN
jgi:hypothetical protein